jgi:H+/Cl- antiporter ClcA
MDGRDALPATRRSSAAATIRRPTQRRRRATRRKTVNGIWLRSDSDGSTKSAFYDGTIVAQSHLRPAVDDPSRDAANRSEYPEQQRHQTGSLRKKKSSRQERDSSASKQSTVSDIYSSSDRSTAQEVQPLLQASGNTLSSSFAVRPSQFAQTDRNRLGSSDVSSRDGDGLGSAVPGVGDTKISYAEVDNKRDSLRYSSQSIFSTITQQQRVLLGTKFVDEDGVQDVEMQRGNSLTSDLDMESLHDGSAHHPVASSPDAMPYSLDGNPGAFLARASVFSIGSGAYWSQPAPQGPILPGMLRGVMQQGGNPKEQQPIRPSNSTQQAGGLDLLDTDYGSNLSMGGNQNNYDLPPNSEPTIQEQEDETGEIESEEITPMSKRMWPYFDISGWLSKHVSYDGEGVPHFESAHKWSIAGMIRSLLYDPIYPEFTSLQQFCWAVVIGAFMGVFTAAWKLLADACVQLTWKTVPERLLAWGVFTDLDGAFPLYHYMWIVPGLFGGILSYITAVIPFPIPTQNDWIESLHTRGIQESESLVPTFLLSTAGMASGLSLGSELPLLLTAGMIGSWLGTLCRQSLLQARVMNLTAAAAAISGFFGFPMAGALFVLEIPHRMGLQYFEALTPATIASIVAVLINRMVIDDDVTGMFQYPFLNQSLPSSIFKDAIIYGVFGGALGIFYTISVKMLKSGLHNLFHVCENPSGAMIDSSTENCEHYEEQTPLVDSGRSVEKNQSDDNIVSNSSCCRPCNILVSQEPRRAALTGVLAGVAVGITGMFLPHVMFWGEAQLQFMIDKGTTPLPVFGRGDTPTAALVALGHCMIGSGQESGLSLGCWAAIGFSKILVTGLSLGTGIVGGHFWGPLFVGCAASHFLTDLMVLVSDWLGVSLSLSQYPCVSLLCIMGSAHVATCEFGSALSLARTLFSYHVSLSNCALLQSARTWQSF